MKDQEAVAKEKQKVAKYAQLIRNKRLNFIPAAFTTFGALGPESTHLINDAADCFLAKNAADRGVCRMQLVQRVQVGTAARSGQDAFGMHSSGGGGGRCGERNDGLSIAVRRADVPLFSKLACPCVLSSSFDTTVTFFFLIFLFFFFNVVTVSLVYCHVITFLFSIKTKLAVCCLFGSFVQYCLSPSGLRLVPPFAREEAPKLNFLKTNSSQQNVYRPVVK